MSPLKQPFTPLQGIPLLEEFRDLLKARTGLLVRDKDWNIVARALDKCSEDLKLTPSNYMQRLVSGKIDGVEWGLLMPLLTNGESYFERDKGQFALLKNKILPELIEKRRAKGERTLRLWSAGCSTGEEAYSLAMVTDSVLPNGWNVSILGTDINGAALQNARHGVYGEWSFRGVEDATRKSYFRPITGGHQVSDALRQRVIFRFCNLSAADWPSTTRDIADMDLIVCRNVLIYFERRAVADVLQRFALTLREGGYLVTGHAELHDQNIAPLQARLFAESTVYQKPEENSAANSRRPVSPSAFPMVAPHRNLPTPAVRPVPSRRPFLSDTSTRKPRTETPPPLLTKTAQQWCGEARRHADAGRYDEAIECCRSAIKRDLSFVEVYLLWARIAEEQGRTGETKELLKKVMYLAPNGVEAYVELAAIYEREGDALRARQMRLSVLKMLETSEAPASSMTMLKEHLQGLVGENHSLLTETERGSKR